MTSGPNPAEPQLRQIKPLGEDLDHPNRAIHIDPAFQAFRKQRGLAAICSLKKRTDSSANRAGIITRESLPSARFYTTKTYSLRLDVRLANDAAVVVILPARGGGEIRAAHP